MNSFTKVPSRRNTWTRQVGSSSRGSWTDKNSSVHPQLPDGLLEAARGGRRTGRAGVALPKTSAPGAKRDHRRSGPGGRPGDSKRNHVVGVVEQGCHGGENVPLRTRRSLPGV